MKFDYYNCTEMDQFTFVKLPKTILFDKTFEELSLVAKVLYGLLLDRMSLSKYNNWFDNEQHVFIIYQIAEIQEDLKLSKKKAIECLAELEKFGLVEKKRRGQGLPNILYVKNFNKKNTVEEKVTENFKEKNEKDNDFSFRSVKNDTFGSAESDTIRIVDLETSKSSDVPFQEVTKWTPIKNKKEVNNTYMSNYNLNIYNKETPIQSYHISEKREVLIKRCDDDKMREYAALIKKNIEYEDLLMKYPYEQGMIEGIYELIIETVLGKGESVLISSNYYPQKLVKEKFLKLNSFHVEYVIECVQKNTSKVRNIKKYLLAALFNASSTMDGYYRNEVNWQFAQ